MLEYYYTVAKQLYRLRMALCLLLLLAFFCFAWALFSDARSSDQYLLPALVLSAWLLLAITAAHHNEKPQAPPADASFFQRIGFKLQRGMSYGLAWLIVLCSGALLWFSITTVRLFINGGSY